MALQESNLKAFDIPLDEIYSDPEFNCRGRIAPLDVVELSKTIEADGLIQAISVQPYHHPTDPKIKFRVVSGNRRFTAFKLLAKSNPGKWNKIPATIQELNENQARRLNLLENLKRKDLNMLQEAKALEHFRIAGMTQEEVAKYLDMSRGWVQTRFAVLDLPADIQQEVAAGLLTQEQVKQIHHMPKEKQYEAVRALKDAKLKGIKGLKLQKPKVKPYSRKKRDDTEIFAMMEHIQDVVGNGFWTRCLAWCAGTCSSLELYRDLKDFAKEKGIRYEIPQEVVSNL